MWFTKEEGYENTYGNFSNNFYFTSYCEDDFTDVERNECGFIIQAIDQLFSRQKQFQRFRRLVSQKALFIKPAFK